MTKNRWFLRLLATMAVIGFLGYFGYAQSINLASEINSNDQIEEWVSIESPTSGVTRLVGLIQDDLIVETSEGHAFAYCGMPPQWEVCWEDIDPPFYVEINSCAGFDLLPPPVNAIDLLENCIEGEEPSLFRFALLDTGEVLAYKNRSLAGTIMVQVARGLGIIIFGTMIFMFLGVIVSLIMIWGWRPSK